MTDDIVKRLRTTILDECRYCNWNDDHLGCMNSNAELPSLPPDGCVCSCHTLHREAADEIERLRAENAVLRETAHQSSLDDAALAQACSVEPDREFGGRRSYQGGNRD